MTSGTFLIRKNLLVKAKQIKYADEFIPRNEQTAEILNDQNDYLLIAKPGSGKTRFCIDMAKTMGLKMVIAVPLVVMTEQFSKKYGLKPLSRFTTDKELKGLIDEQIITSTYNSISRLIYAGLKAKSYILVIDEYHNLIASYDFRDDTLIRLYNLKHRFKKTVSLTGTPEGCVLTGKQKIIRFKGPSTKPSLTINIIHSKNRNLENLISHVLLNCTHGKTVIYIENKDDLKLIREKLLASSYKERQVAIIDSDRKLERDYRHISKHGIFRRGVRIVLTTSVFAEGVDIENSEIKHFYCFYCSNLIRIRQFISRFRRANPIIYDFVPANKRNQLIFDLESQIRLDLRHYKIDLNNFQYYLTRIKQSQISLKDTSHPKNINNQLKSNIFYFDDLEHKYVLNELKVRSDRLFEFHNLLFGDSILRKEYYEEFENCQVEISYYSANGISLTTERETLIAKKKSSREKLLALYEEYPSEVVDAFKYKVLNKPLDENQIDNSGEFYKENIEEFRSHNKLLLQTISELTELSIHPLLISKLIHLDNRKLNYFKRCFINRIFTRAKEELVSLNEKKFSKQYVKAINWIISLVEREKFFPDELFKEYKQLPENKYSQQISQEQMVKSIGEVLDLERRSVRINKNVVKYRLIKGFLTEEQILSKIRNSFSNSFSKEDVQLLKDAVNYKIIAWSVPNVEEEYADDMDF